VTDPLVLVLLVLLLVTALAVVAFRRLLAAIVAFGVYSLGMAMLWAVFRAPDVGLTEAAVGAGVTTALFIVVVFRADVTRTTTFRPIESVRGRSIAVVAGFVAALLWTVPALPAVGDPSAPGFQRVAPEYLARSPELGVANVVTAILVVFRGFDTFGEVVVVFAAGVAVLVVFDREVIR
jgi:multicomponent Na+:H+ antiporter subunit B